MWTVNTATELAWDQAHNYKNPQWLGFWRPCLYSILKQPYCVGTQTNLETAKRAQVDMGSDETPIGRVPAESFEFLYTPGVVRRKLGTRL